MLTWISHLLPPTRIEIKDHCRLHIMSQRRPPLIITSFTTMSVVLSQLTPPPPQGTHQQS